jgi:drug/metabolite transporter (DMT)-like permease
VAVASPPARPYRRLGYLLVALAAVFAASNGIFGRLLIETGFSADAVAAIRIYGAAVILVFVAAPYLRRLGRRDLLLLIVFGLIAFVLGQGAYFQAIERIDVAIVLVIVFMAPLVVAIYERVRHAVTLPAHAYAAIVLAIVGLALAILGGGVGIGAISILGLVFSVTATCTYVIGVILAARLPRALPPLANTGTAIVIGAIGWLAIVPPWTLPWDRLTATAVFEGRFGFSLPAWIAVLVVIVIGSIGVYATWIGGTKLVGPGSSSMVGMIEPVLGAILAWSLLAQSLSALQALGIAITVGAIVVVERARSRRPG